MNIAVLLLNRGRGSGEVARQHAKHLIKKGHKVYFMHPEVGEGVDNAININIKLHSDKTPVHEYLPAAGETQQAVSMMSYEEVMSYLPDYESALGSIINDVDIIIGHHANLSAIATYNVASRHNKPYVLFLHGTGIEPRHHGQYDDQVWSQIENSVKKANGIIVTTEYVRDQLVKPLIDLSDDKFIILPCGVDLDDFHPKNINGIVEKYSLQKTYVICPGALMAVKGPQNIVAASEHYSDIAETIFIGDGKMRKELEERLGDRGRFFGFVSSEDKAKLINAAALVVAAPVKKEHFGIIYAEGLAGGTPTVAYNGGGVSSIIIPEVGVLTERNSKDLGKAILELLQNTELRKKMAIAARPRAERYFSYPDLVNRLEQWLFEFL